MFSITLPQRCFHCGTMSRRLVYWADRYVCDATPCLTVAIRAAGARLGVDPAEIEAVMPYAIVRIRESFHES